MLAARWSLWMSAMSSIDSRLLARMNDDLDCQGTFEGELKNVADEVFGAG